MNKPALASALAIFVIAFPVFSTAQRAALTEYPLPSSSTGGAPFGITQGPDGAVWFTEETFGPNNIGRITSAGLITEFPVTDGVLGNSITSGPDGALWFTEWSGKIGRITTDGVITGEYPVSAQPISIVAGPDGALWFLEEYSSTFSIGRMTTSGVVTNEYRISSSPLRITVGPDGALWFTENSGQVGRITTSGSLTEFTLPSGVRPYGITAGSDGALWLSEPGSAGAGTIGRLTTDGVLTNQYSVLPYGLSQPDGICLGPDGAIWFTASAYGTGGGEHFGRITTSGVITAYTLPTNLFPGAHAITAGTDGALWLTEFNGDAIGRVALDPAAPATTLTVTNMGYPDPVEANEDLTYTITVTNTGPANATGVSLTDPLISPPYTLVSVTPSQGSCSAGTNLVCTLGNLANGNSATVAVVITQIVGGSANTATVTANETGQVPYSPFATASPIVEDAFADLTVTAVGSPNPVAEGANLTYAITLSNAGPLDATNVTLIENSLPSDQATAISAVPSQGTCSDATDCALGTIPAGSAATVSMVVVPTAVGTLSNTLRVQSPQGGLVRPEVDTEVGASPDFTSTGPGATVQPTDPTTQTSPVTITYNNVSIPGSTSVTSSSSGPLPPTGFSLGNPATYYDLSTTSKFTGPVSVCFNYAGISFAGAPELFHYQNGNWVDVTVSVDTVHQIICGSVTSFSPFVILQRQCATTPSLSVSLSPNSLWPPNNKIVPITASLAVHDACDPNPSVSLVSITANESLARGDITGASYGTDDRSFGLAASRSGSGNGRIYTVTYELADHFGQSATASSAVTVAHDQGH